MIARVDEVEFGSESHTLEYLGRQHLFGDNLHGEGADACGGRDIDLGVELVVGFVSLRDVVADPYDRGSG